MNTKFKLPAVLVLVLLTLAVSVPTALAAAPTNDTFANATPATIGFSEVLDTTQATTDSTDAQLNTWCGAPATDASVWYVLQGSDRGVVVDVSQSSYSAGVLIGVASPGALEIVACGPGGSTFFAEAGTTYYVLAIDDQFDGGGNGGLLSISFTEAPPPPTLDITVNPTGTVNTRTGVATISGTYTCTSAEFIEVYGQTRQVVGSRFAIDGYFGFSDSGTCDGASHNWSAQVYPENGKFAGGKTMTVAFSYSCSQFACVDGYAEQTVLLKGGGK